MNELYSLELLRLLEQANGVSMGGGQGRESYSDEEGPTAPSRRVFSSSPKSGREPSEHQSLRSFAA
ncbi:MAG: hypothetical protein DMG64_19665 [Acidobacteria bacterium]|nr:MAG: hypothetical protein DMG63_15340 [Acidobacteriota bacterium]PYX99356.1 MAG: hypothetical protein DMG64_19665 [Acidobacteriota bacterium]